MVAFIPPYNDPFIELTKRSEWSYVFHQSDPHQYDSDHHESDVKPCSNDGRCIGGERHVHQVRPDTNAQEHNTQPV